MHYVLSCAIFKAVIIAMAKGLTRFWVVIILYTCKPATVNMTPSEQF